MMCKTEVTCTPAAHFVRMLSFSLKDREIRNGQFAAN